MARDDGCRADAPEPLRGVSIAEQKTTNRIKYLNPSDISRPRRLHGSTARGGPPVLSREFLGGILVKDLKRQEGGEGWTDILRRHSALKQQLSKHRERIKAV